jgi:hypothetical protein
MLSDYYLLDDTNKDKICKIYGVPSLNDDNFLNFIKTKEPKIWNIVGPDFVNELDNLHKWKKVIDVYASVGITIMNNEEYDEYLHHYMECCSEIRNTLSFKMVGNDKLNSLLFNTESIGCQRWYMDIKILKFIFLLIFVALFVTNIVTISNNMIETRLNISGPIESRLSSYDYGERTNQLLEMSPTYVKNYENIKLTNYTLLNGTIYHYPDYTNNGINNICHYLYNMMIENISSSFNVDDKTSMITYCKSNIVLDTYYNDVILFYFDNAMRMPDKNIMINNNVFLHIPKDFPNTSSKIVMNITVFDKNSYINYKSDYNYKHFMYLFFIDGFTHRLLYFSFWIIPLILSSFILFILL